MTGKCQIMNDEWSAEIRSGIRHSSFIIRALMLAIRCYQLTISPAQVFLFGPTGGCRFTPTCSQYAMDAIRARGAMAGGWLAVKRICRCHPWCPSAHDPFPQNKTILPPLLSKRGEGGGEGSNRFQIPSPRPS